MKIFNLKRMLGLLAIGGAVAYARSKKLDVLGMLGLRRGATPVDTTATASTAAAAAPNLDLRPDTATPEVGAAKNYAGFGDHTNSGFNRPR